MMLKDRIQAVRKHFNLPRQSDLSTIIKVSVQRLRELESGRSVSLRVEEAIAFEVNFKVSAWWLMSGQGKMLLSEDGSCSNLYLDREYQINLLPGAVEHSSISIDKHFFFDKKKTQFDYKVVQVVGDSMQPTLNNGDFVIADMTKKSSLDSGLYVIVLGMDFYVKRLQFMRDNSIKIISDNGTYETEIIQKQDIEIVGMVVLKIQNC